MRASTYRCLLATAVFASLVGCGGESKPEKADPSVRAKTTERATPALKPGDTLPPLEAPGWVNGPPAAPNSPGVKLLVVDLWARWCPYCRTSAPGLVRAHKKFADKGVAFISLTNHPKEIVRAYMKETEATWPHAYDITVGTISALGAGSGMPGPVEYEIAPTLYLVGPDGKILWVDSRGRMRHVEPAKWEADVDAAIEAALAAPEPKP